MKNFFLPYVIILEYKSHLKCDCATMTYFVICLPGSGKVGVMYFGYPCLCRAYSNHRDITGEGLVDWCMGE